MKRAAMRAMLPKDLLERFVDGPLHCEEIRNRVSTYVGEKLAGQDMNTGAQPMDIGQTDKSEGEDEDVNAVQQRHLHDPTRSTGKSPTTSECLPTVGLPICHHRHHASRLHETRNLGAVRRNGCGEEEASHLPQVWWKRPSFQALPISR